MVQCSTAVKQMSLQMFFEYCQTSSVDYIVRVSVPHGRCRDGESATADDRSCPWDDQPLRTACKFRTGVTVPDTYQAHLLT